MAAIAPQRRIWIDRIRTVALPLFPGYVFARFDPARRTSVEMVPGVASVVRFGSQCAPVDEKELQAIRQLVASGMDVSASPFLEVGSRVRVIAGSMKGVEGLLCKRKGVHQLVVSISLLQRSVSVEMDEAFVEAMNSPQRAGVA